MSDTLPLLKNPWYMNDNTILMATALSLHRNLENNLFETKLSSDRKKALLDLLSKVLTNGLYFPADTLTPTDKLYLYECFLESHKVLHTDCGNGFFIDEQQNLFASFNIEDHLKLTLVDKGQEIEKSYNELLKLENLFSKSFNFAFSKKFGFLTADPRHAGCGLSISSYLHLPILIHLNFLEEVLDEIYEKDSLATSLEDNDEYLADIVILKNRFSIGVNEEKIISSHRSACLALISHEKKVRNELTQEEQTRIKDKLSKAYGMLLHSYQLDTKETLEALSLCKLGIEMGYLVGIDLKAINSLFFTIRRGHVQQDHQGKDISDLPKLRAEKVHKALENTNLIL